MGSSFVATIPAFRQAFGFIRDDFGPVSELIAVGDAFTITSGCDQRFATCRHRFANGVNFRDFPAIPGNDFVISYPVLGKGQG